MDYYNGVVIEYLRADRKIFVNSQLCIQINAANNPDTSSPHWYCDVAASDFGSETLFLCEISYSKNLYDLIKRLKSWNEHWPAICNSLRRDSALPIHWTVRPWLFLPEHLVPLLLLRLKKLEEYGPLAFTSRITTLEMTQPWLYRSWNRVGEGEKPVIIPSEMGF